MSRRGSARRCWAVTVACVLALGLSAPGGAQAERSEQSDDGERQRGAERLDRKIQQVIDELTRASEQATGDEVESGERSRRDRSGKGRDRPGEDGKDRGDRPPSAIFASPGIPPPGANDFDCQPSDERPFPVVLVHGTFADMTISWNLISPELVRRGYCVFALDYGERGTGPIEESAAELDDFVDEVLDATGARKVSIVGHSQGGMMPRHYMRFLDGRKEVDELIGLSPSNHGTTNPLAPPAGGLCPACVQQVKGSPFIRRLNRGKETLPGIDYTVIQTRFDEVVTPFTSAFLEGSRSRVTNVTLQDRCRLDLVEHLGIVYDPVALQWIVNALGRDGPAQRDFRPVCL